jgi:hypothetical protein
VSDHDWVGSSTGPEQALLTEFAEIVVEEVAPEELLVFPETAQEFLENPNRALQSPSREEPVGFGLDVALVTPYVLAIAGPVLTYLLAVAADTLKEGSKTLVGEWIRRLFKKKDEASALDQEAAAALTSEQARRVRDIAYERATLLGLSADRAALLADAVVGGVRVAE